jgi:hypothetical protein
MRADDPKRKHALQRIKQWVEKALAGEPVEAALTGASSAE